MLYLVFIVQLDEAKYDSKIRYVREILTSKTTVYKLPAKALTSKFTSTLHVSTMQHEDWVNTP